MRLGAAPRAVNATTFTMAAPTRTPRSTWIDAGLGTLAAGGPDAVRIDPLAKSLGVTRGGFYWHFADRDALLAEMLDAWERRSIDEVIAQVEAEGVDAEARLWRLFGLASSSGSELVKIDLAVRDWARRDAGVAARLRRVDGRRMAYLRTLFGALGLDDAEVEARCLLVMSLWVGNHLVATGHGARRRRDVIELALRRVVG